MTYIYIFEDGQVAHSDTAPTTTDGAMIADGLLQVVSVGETVHGVNDDGSLYELEEAILETYESGTAHTILL